MYMQDERNFHQISSDKFHGRYLHKKQAEQNNVTGQEPSYYTRRKSGSNLAKTSNPLSKECRTLARQTGFCLEFCKDGDICSWVFLAQPP